VRLRLTVLTCGTCGKPRGLRHACASARKRKRPRLGLVLSFTCGTCGKAVRNPLAHTCTVRTDLRRRRAAQERKSRAAARRERRRRQRAEAAARRKAAARERRAKARARAKAAPRPPRHDPHACRDPECQRYPCRVYRDGFADGLASAGRDD
jgi:hypothetical protein